jgi:hypothetical protein
MGTEANSSESQRKTPQKLGHIFKHQIFKLNLFRYLRSYAFNEIHTPSKFTRLELHEIALRIIYKLFMCSRGCI